MGLWPTDPAADVGAAGWVVDGKSIGAGELGAVTGAAPGASFAVVVSVGACLSRLMTRSGRSRASSSDGRRDSVDVGTAAFAAGAALIVLPSASALDGFAVRDVALVAAATGSAAGVTAVDGSAAIVAGRRGSAAGVTAVDGSAIAVRG